MKQKTILMTLACLLLSAVAAFAQTKTDFAGEWTLDLSKSKLPEVMRIESGTMKVTQTDKDITVATDFKRTPRTDGGGNGGGNGQGSGGGLGRGMSGQPTTYTLDGKETSVEVPGPQGNPTVAKLKADWDGNKLKLTSKRSFNTQNGEITTTSKETWELVDGGKGLKLMRETESLRGTQTSEMYFTKK